MMRGRRIQSRIALIEEGVCTGVFSAGPQENIGMMPSLRALTVALEERRGKKYALGCSGSSNVQSRP